MQLSDPNEEEQTVAPGGEEPPRNKLVHPLQGEVGKEGHIGQVVFVPVRHQHCQTNINSEYGRALRSRRTKTTSCTKVDLHSSQSWSQQLLITTILITRAF